MMRAKGNERRTASTAGRSSGCDADAEGRGLFFMDFAEDNLSSLFKPTDRLDMTARACVRVVCLALSLCACVFQAARLGPGAQAGVQHGGPR